MNREVRSRGRSVLVAGGFWLAGALAFSAGASAQERPASLPPSASPFGMNHTFLHWDSMDGVAPAWVRLNLHWGYFEPEDEPDTSQWSWTNDETYHIDSLLAHGYRPVAVVRTGTVWANRGTGSEPYVGPSYPPDDLTDVWDPATGYSPSYHRFIRTLIAHYNGNGVRRFPILVVENEANAGNWWRGLEEDDTPFEVAEQYLRLLATAYHAAKTVDPGILVADSGVASETWGAVMVKEMLDAGAPDAETLAFANTYFARGFNINWGWPYHWPDIDSLRADFESVWAFLVNEQDERLRTILSGLRFSDRHPSGVANVDVLNFHFYENAWALPPILDWMRTQIGDSLPPVFSNEYGSRAAIDPPAGAGGEPAWSAYYQGYGDCGFDDSDGAGNELIAKTVTALAAGVSPVFWFTLDGIGSLDATDKLELAVFAVDEEAGYPVTRVRPMYHGAAFLARALAREAGHTATPARDTCLAPEVHRYVFPEQEAGRPDLEILWWDDGSWHEYGLAARGGMRVAIEAPAGATSARVYRDYLYPDHYQRLSPEDGAAFGLAGEAIAIDVTEHPMALVWDGDLTPVAGDDWEPSCGISLAEAPAAVPRRYGWDGLEVRPNPFVGETQVRFHMPAPGRVRMRVHDVQGRETAVLMDGPATPGWRSVTWRGRDGGGERVAPGVYYVTVEASDLTEGECGGEARPVVAREKVLLLR